MCYTKSMMVLFMLSLFACGQKEDEINSSEPNLIFQFKFDEQQERLDGLGNPVSVPKGNAAQSPDFNSMSVHYIEFVPNKFTQVGEGAIVYEGETQASAPNSGFDKAIVWDKAIKSGAQQVFRELSLSQLPAGTYEYLRASVTYQNADIRFNLINLPPPLPSELNNQRGTFSGFIGFNTHINELTVKDYSISVNADKPQGFWAFEPHLDSPYQDLYLQYANASGVESGQSPSGTTTVVNLLDAFGVSLPQGSCIVTGKLKEPLIITGEETKDIKVILSFSVNQSFEWVDINGNGEWDLDVSGQTIEQVVDMGLRGLVIQVD